MSRIVGHFRIIPRKTRVLPNIASVKDASKRFKVAEAAGDTAAMDALSDKAWNALTAIFEALRNEQDQGRLARSYMMEATGHIANHVSSSEQQAMIAARKLDLSHPSLRRMTLRDALNKVAHHDTTFTTYRLDGRGAHYLILGGSHQNRNWVAEVLVSTLVKHARKAAKAIR